MDFKNIPKNYRPIPFWSWNDKLDPEETREQVHKMNDAGMGGFFMHARGGLQTEYMSDEWFDNVSAAVDTAHECGMHPWAYDENGWPSGFGNGVVNGMGVEYQQKYLRMSSEEHAENAICKNGEHWFYFEINPFYVDTLDKKVIKEFLNAAYLPYYEKYKDNFDGFFSDEPQISRNGIPWSFVFRDEYKARYGENLYEHLEELFLNINDYKNTRIKFWKMVTDLFSSAYMKQIHDWCLGHNVKFTGHLVLEENLLSQLVSNGACMPHYEYFDIPGMDWLCRYIYDCLTPKQLSSVAEQLGQDLVLSETFALCGHNVSFAELKGIYEWQLVHGINLLCQHLEGYSIRGIRKRDYPPAMYTQQPWWSEYKGFVDALSREGMVLSKGTKTANVLVMHPQTTAWTLFDGNEQNTEIDALDKKLLSVMHTLEVKHISYHLGDETIMERHASVMDGKIIIGKQSYDRVIMSCCEYLLPNTQKLIDEFVKSGGKIVTADEIPPNDITDRGDITYTKRGFDGFSVHYFTNTSPERKTANINVSGKVLDIYSGDLLPFSGRHEFEPWGSLMIIEDGSANEKEKAAAETVTLNGEFKISKPVRNTLTLDRCDYWFDGELQEKNGYVLNICERANALERPVKIRMEYHIKINHIPEKLEMASETPEKFKISINNKPLTAPVTGRFADKSFKTIDITDYAKTGDNVIAFECDFAQSGKFYSDLKKAAVFESEKNKLVYDMEIEAIYLLGNFSVKTDGKWTKLDRNAVRYNGTFEIDSPKTTVNIKNIEQQGFPFFCGEMEIEGEIDIPQNAALQLDTKGINAVRVSIGDKEKVMLTDNRLPLDDFGTVGKTKIKLTLINNLRNLLGPHHLKEGEAYAVGPSAFFKEPCIWNFSPEKDWDDDYCFVETGI